MAPWLPNRLPTHYSQRSKKDSTFGDTRYSKSTRIRNVRVARKSSLSTNWLMALSDRSLPRLLSSMRLFRRIAIWSQTNTLERSSSASKGCGNALLVLVSSFIWLAPSLRGQFVYVANGGGSNNVSAYKIGLNGSLTAIPGSPLAARNLPSSLGVDPRLALLRRKRSPSNRNRPCGQVCLRRKRGRQQCLRLPHQSER